MEIFKKYSSGDPCKGQGKKFRVSSSKRAVSKQMFVFHQSFYWHLTETCLATVHRQHYCSIHGLESAHTVPTASERTQGEEPGMQCLGGRQEGHGKQGFYFDFAQACWSYEDASAWMYAGQTHPLGDWCKTSNGVRRKPTQESICDALTSPCSCVFLFSHQTMFHAWQQVSFARCGLSDVRLQRFV